MKFCMQLPWGSPLENTKLQLDHKGQRSKRSQGQRPKFQKLHKNHFAYKEGITQWFYTSFHSKKVYCRRFGGFSPLCKVFKNGVVVSTKDKWISQNSFKCWVTLESMYCFTCFKFKSWRCVYARMNAGYFEKKSRSKALWLTLSICIYGFCKRIFRHALAI